MHSSVERGSVALTNQVHSYAEYDRARLSNVFPDNGKAGWPTDLVVSELKIGLMYLFTVQR